MTDAALPPNGDPSAPAGPGAASVASTDTVAALKADPIFSKAYLAGDPGAVSRMSAAMKAQHAEGAAPQQSGDSSHPPEQPDPEGQAALAEYGPLVGGFTEDTDPRVIADANITAAIGARAFEVDPGFARGAITTLDNAIKARYVGGQPREMDEVERAQMDSILTEKLGDQYDARMDLLESRLAAAGPKAADWLKRALRSAGPNVAAMIIMSLTRPRDG